MADKKISQLTSLAQGDVAVSTDTLPIVDVSATETKKIAVNALVGAAAAAGLTSVDINSGAIDGTTIGSSSASTGAFTTLSASSTVSGTGFSTYLASPPAIGGTAAAAGTFTNLTASGTVSFSGATVSNGGSVTTVDINGGTIDGATIATSDITVGSGKTLNVSAGTLTLADNQISGDKVEGGTINAITINTLTSTAVNATTVDATNVEVTNVKAKDGTASIAIADSTGVASLSANPILSGGTANGVLYLNGSKVATSGSALTFDGTTLSATNSSAGSNVISATKSADGNVAFFRRIGGTFNPGLFISLSDTTNNEIIFNTTYSSGNVPAYVWQNASTEAMRLTSTGLGIGTSSPSYKLDVNTTGGSAATARLNGNDQANVRLRLENGGSGGRTWEIVGGLPGVNNSNFTIYDVTAAATRATITSGGDFGIGTTSPGVKLDVYNAGNSQMRLSTSASGNLKVEQNTNGAFIGTTSSDASAGILRFGTADTERGRFTAGGYFKASNTGTYNSSTSSQHEFYQTDNANTLRLTSTSSAVSGAYGLYVDLTADPNATDSFFIRCYGGANQRASIRSNGGLANYQSNNVDLSDARTKKDIAPAASMWGKIGALEIVTYKYNDQTHDDVNVGVIAQQVESVEPVWVDADGFGETPEGEEPLKTVYTKDITFAAIKALQEAMARIEQLEAKVAVLESK